VVAAFGLRLDGFGRQDTSEEALRFEQRALATPLGELATDTLVSEMPRKKAHSYNWRV